MAQAVLETLLYREYLKRDMPPEEAAAKAREAAAAYKAQTGLSEEEIVAGMRQQQEAEDFKSFAKQVLTKSPVLSDMPRRASTQRVLGASALTSSVNPETRELGESTLRNSVQDPAVRAALAKTVADQAQAQRTALFDEKMRRGAVPLTRNASPETIAYAESVRRPYDTSAIISDQDRVDEAVAAAKRRAEAAQEVSRETARGNTMGNLRSDRLANEANLAAYGAGQQASYPSSSAIGESIQRALEMANAKANNMEFEGSLFRNYNAPQNYDVDTQSFRGLPSAVPPPSSTVDRSGEDVDDLRLAQDITGPTAAAAEMRAKNLENAKKEAAGQMAMYAMTSPQATNTAATPARPAGAASTARPTPPAPLAPPADFRRGETASLLSRIFGGPEYQSTGDRVVKQGGQGVNFGSGESAADFFRADRELRKQRPEMFERQAEARGGATKASGGGGKDAALHKALEIIHHMLVRGR